MCGLYLCFSRRKQRVWQDNGSWAHYHYGFWLYCKPFLIRLTNDTALRLLTLPVQLYLEMLVRRSACKAYPSLPRRKSTESTHVRYPWIIHKRYVIGEYVLNMQAEIRIKHMTSMLHFSLPLPARGIRTRYTLDCGAVSWANPHIWWISGAWRGRSSNPSPSVLLRQQN